MEFSVPGFGQIRDMVLTCTERDRGGRGNSQEVEVAMTLISGVKRYFFFIMIAYY